MKCGRLPELRAHHSVHCINQPTERGVPCGRRTPGTASRPPTSPPRHGGLDCRWESRRRQILDRNNKYVTWHDKSSPVKRRTTCTS